MEKFEKFFFPFLQILPFSWVFRVNVYTTEVSLSVILSDSEESICSVLLKITKLRISSELLMGVKGKNEFCHRPVWEALPLSFSLS
jgi:hypothetical protein